MNRRHLLIVTAVLVAAVGTWWSLACEVDRGRAMEAISGKNEAVGSARDFSQVDESDGGRRSSWVRDRKNEQPLAVRRHDGMELRVSRSGGVQVALAPDGPRLFREAGRDSIWSQSGVWIRWRMKGGGELPGEAQVDAGWYNPGVYSSAIAISAANGSIRFPNPDLQLVPLRPGEAVTRTTVAKLMEGYDRYRSRKLPKLDEMEFQIRASPPETGLFTADGKRIEKDAMKDLETEWISGDEVQGGE
jgi:hypothetical protein